MSTPETPAVVTPVQPQPAIEYLTPVGITIAILVVMLAISFSGAGAQHRIARSGRAVLYLMTIGWEWLITGIIFLAVRKSGKRIRDVIGGRWATVEDILLDVAVAAVFWLASIVVLLGAAYLVGLTNTANVESARNATTFLMPQTALELALWPVVTFTAGFCEETIFRGYFLRQFAAMTQNAWLGMVFSSLAFGLSHGYQGPKLMFVITVYGMLFAMLAHFRKSTRPGMIVHAWQDTMAGFVRHFLRM